MSIYPTYGPDASGLAGSLYLTVYAADLSTVVYARSAAGVVEIGSTGIYGIPGGIAAAVGLSVWDISGVLQAAEMLVDDAAATAPIVLPAGGVSPLVSQIFRIKRGDLEPIIFPITELDIDGNQVVQDVTGWTGKFKLRATPDVGSIILNNSFYISDANGNVTTDGSAGLLAYRWAAHETDTAGQFLAEFECIRADGVKKTYPTTSVEPLPGEYIQVHVIPDLDDSGSY